jgi:hypothetical protein
MARCTAPVRGHTRGGGADCPVCGPPLSWLQVLLVLFPALLHSVLHPF